MHNPESVLENETHKFLWDFELQTDHLISARQPNQLIVNKNEEPAELWTCRPGRSLSKTEIKQKQR